MQYTLSYQKAHQHYIDIQFTVDKLHESVTYLQLPSWRPGRYELGNFAKNIQKFRVTDGKGQALSYKKVSKDRWEVQTAGVAQLTVHYNYYANQMDAGSSYLDEEQLYVNFINCLIYAEGRLDEECSVKLKLPSDYEIACGLQQPDKHLLHAPSYYVLVDSPMIASNQLQHRTYRVKDTSFHIWVMGHCRLNWEQALEDFRKFSEVQVAAMEGFPTDDYHFLYQFLPYKAYHGVEHYNSTIITLGPDYEINSPELYKNFVGVSSHELYHCWNIIRIRPAEMMPYNFTRENYFVTGFVAEGVTTYLGDVFLARGGVFSLDDYLQELNKVLQRHLTNWGRFNHSLADSSWDMWLDGYTPGIPNRKVSIYIKGALVSLLLDLKLRSLTHNEGSLDSVMRILNKEFAEQQRGYTYGDFQEVAAQVAGQNLQDYFEQFITGQEPLENALGTALDWVGLRLHQRENNNALQRLFGLKVMEKDGLTFVADTAPGSPADELLSKNDEIIAVNGVRVTTHLEEQVHTQTEVRISFFRNHQLKEVVLKPAATTFYQEIKIIPDPQASPAQLENRKTWIGHA
ncbi:M61 family metallopeptidase [Nafulsella turpanensis]|uniref:M61 family metallopeptidase n=1 Tax=Nafulsella turpanensis TaxID=1265690 RepID=UPI00034D2FC1|nr:PDZ domain-containing protein [Nafulsella turpanensis]